MALLCCYQRLSNKRLRCVAIIVHTLVAVCVHIIAVDEVIISPMRRTS